MNLIDFDIDKNSILNVKNPINPEQLKGQVVLLDFWTYSCINCIHILPQLEELEKAFSGQSFIVVGIHSPKFTNEKEVDNIKNAIRRYKIKHPILIDNDHTIWDKFGIRAWPSFLLFDAEGKLRGRASGENIFRTIHKSVVQLLDEGRKKNILKKPLKMAPTITKDKSTLSFPGKIALGESNILYISDSGNNRILETKIQDSKLQVRNIIGFNNVGKTNGSFNQVTFNNPQGLAYFENKLFVCDTDNHLIRLIDFEKKVVKTLAGTGEQGDWRTNSGHTLKTNLNSPWDCLIYNNSLFITMAGNHQIWRLDLKDDILEKYAGSGWENLIDGKRETAQFSQPSGIAYDEDNLYVADSESSSIRYISWRTGLVKTLIGEGLFDFGLIDGNLINGRLQHPLGIEYFNNFLYIADTYNHAIRKIDLEKDEITTILKKKENNVCTIGEEDCDILSLNEPNDIKIFQENKLIIADTNNHLIRYLDMSNNKLMDFEIKF